MRNSQIIDEGGAMKLRDVLDQVPQLDDELVIFARKPWQLDSETRVERFDSGSRIPAHMIQEGFDYFLEVHIARELMEDVSDRSLTSGEVYALILHYAEFDA